MKEIYKLSAFLKTEYGGNKAGVVLNADELTEKEMFNIASNLGYSETAFILKSDIADFKLRFFTPLVEVDLCGHATIAAFNLLKIKDIVRKGTYYQETKAGVLRIDIEKDQVFMEQNLPIFGENIASDEVSKCFNNANYINNRLPISVVSTAIKEIFLPVKSIEELNNLKPNFDEIIKISKKYNVIGIHAFALDTSVDAYGRNFAPIVGINEESATGTSSGALSCYLYKNYKQKEEYTLRQGYSMNQPSEIHIRLKIREGNIYKVFVGGTAKIID
ncbi:MAG: PhzF family phenazine biosynthesis protein [Candidatus Izemoplasma sp.]